jgi:hypothetical protein
MVNAGFSVGDEVVVCYYGSHCGFMGVVTRVLSCFLWVQGASGHVVNVRKHSVALIVEGDSDEESEIAVEEESVIAIDPRMLDLRMPNIIPDYDSDATE